MISDNNENIIAPLLETNEDHIEFGEILFTVQFSSFGMKIYKFARKCSCKLFRNVLLFFSKQITRLQWDMKTVHISFGSRIRLSFMQRNTVIPYICQDTKITPKNIASSSSSVIRSIIDGKNVWIGNGNKQSHIAVAMVVGWQIYNWKNEKDNIIENLWKTQDMLIMKKCCSNPHVDTNLMMILPEACKTMENLISKVPGWLFNIF